VPLFNGCPVCVEDTGAPLTFCRGCRWVRYCSVEHHRAHADVHVCRPMRKATLDRTPATWRTRIAALLPVRDATRLARTSRDWCAAVLQAQPDVDTYVRLTGLAAHPQYRRIRQRAAAAELSSH
jgi:hypothetical protein